MSFPQDIFDGKHAGRSNLSTNRAPDYADYKILVQEIASIQEYLLRLTQNITIMPDLEKQFQDTRKQIEEIRQLICTLTPPIDLIDKLEKLQSDLKSIDVRKQVVTARRDIETQRVALANTQLETLKLRDSIGQEVTGFQNRMYNMFQGLQKEIMGRVETLEEGMKQVSVQIEISNLLKKLQ